MFELRRRTGDGRVLLFGVTDRRDGDSRSKPDSRDWTSLRQVHGSGVVVVRRPGDGAGHTADAAVADVDDATLAVQTADCAPVAFWSPQGPFGVAHAGWKGIVAGVIESTVQELRSLGAVDVFAILGPCIHPHAYEFGPEDLDRVVSKYGASVAAVTADARPALDVPAAISRAVAGCGARIDHDLDMCTSEAALFYSHRVRADTGRQSLFVVRNQQ